MTPEQEKILDTATRLVHALYAEDAIDEEPSVYSLAERLNAEGRVSLCLAELIVAVDLAEGNE